MKLTNKDKVFLETLKRLAESGQLLIDMRTDGWKRLVLCRNYGEKIEAEFNMTRQGVRWRFQRLFNEIYVSAYETIYFIESIMGTDLRSSAMDIAKERAALYQQAQKTGDIDGCRRQQTKNV